MSPDRRALLPVPATHLVSLSLAGIAVIAGALAGRPASAAELSGGEGSLETSSLALAPSRPTAPVHATLEVDARRGLANPGVGGREERTGDESWRLRVVRWTGPAASLGLSVGVGLERTVASQGPAALAVAPSESRVAPEVGVRWRSSWNQDRRVDVDAWRSYPDAAPGQGTGRGANNARVELQFRNPGDDGKLNIPRGAFGLQTSANSQWVLRAKRGGPMVYYRARW